MLNKIKNSLGLIKEATQEFLTYLASIRRQENEILKEENQKKDEAKIQEIKNKLGI